jgi:hypothetical protein
MNSNDLMSEPARIERDIAHTRASLHRKIDEIQHRLNPREQVRAQAERVRSAVRSVDPTPYAGAAALAAVGVGAAMAVTGLRRCHHASAITPDASDFIGE